MSIKLVDQGLAKVRDNCQDQKMKYEQEDATSAKKGMWEGVIVAHVRSITWDMDNPRALVAKLGGKPIPAIVEHVRDGSTVRVFLLPDFCHIKLIMTGLRIPCTR